ncbi:CBS domain-containing protein [Nonomuraea sp. NPDC046570]|uniref:CBS domain-containing protein n=1 Tax=Nonomuraea sp. NPDC046570 TaxID=3155255 RepID=UPI0033D43922
MPIEVRDVMGRVAIAVNMGASFADIVATMKRYAVGAVTVIDADRRPVGMVSGEDLLLKDTDAVCFEGRAATGCTAAELMTSPAVTVTPETPLEEAAQLMREKNVKQLPVIDPLTARVLGTLHQPDVLRALTRSAAPSSL